MPLGGYVAFRGRELPQRKSPDGALPWADVDRVHLDDDRRPAVAVDGFDIGDGVVDGDRVLVTHPAQDDAAVRFGESQPEGNRALAADAALVFLAIQLKQYEFVC